MVGEVVVNDESIKVVIVIKVFKNGCLWLCVVGYVSFGVYFGEGVIVIIMV